MKKHLKEQQLPLVWKKNESTAIKGKSMVEIILTGNFQYDAGVFGLLKIFEKFYPGQYELAEEFICFDINLLNDFSLKWIKMILLQSNIFNNSVYALNGKKNSSKKYRDEIKKFLKNTPIEYEKLDFDKKQKKLNGNISNLIENSSGLEKIISGIQKSGKIFVKDIIEYLSSEIENIEAKPKIKDKKINKLNVLNEILTNDIRGRVKNIKDGKWIRNIIMPFNFNKGMFNVGGKENIFQMEKRFHNDFIKPISSLRKIDSPLNGTNTDICCDFCGIYKVDILNYNKLEKEAHALDRTHLLGSASKTTFSNLYWFGQADIFFCDLCELIMLCTVFGFNDKERNSDLDNANKIFIHSPSLQAVVRLNPIAEKTFSFEKFMDHLLNRIDIEKQKSKYVLSNILFVELRTEGQNTSFKTLHLNPVTTEFIRKNYNVLKSTKGHIYIQKLKEKIYIDIRYELLKRLLEGKRDIQDLINLAFMETINKEEQTSYVSFKSLAILHHRLGVKKMEKVIHIFFEEGTKFSHKLSDNNKKRSNVYSLMQAIRGNNKDRFLDNLFLLYLSYEEVIPIEIEKVISEKIPFQNVGNAFIAGILSTKKSDNETNSTESNSTENKEDNDE